MRRVSRAGRRACGAGLHARPATSRRLPCIEPAAVRRSLSSPPCRLRRRKRRDRDRVRDVVTRIAPAERHARAFLLHLHRFDSGRRQLHRLREPCDCRRTGRAGAAISPQENPDRASS